MTVYKLANLLQDCKSVRETLLKKVGEVDGGEEEVVDVS